MIKRPICLLCILFMTGIWVMSILKIPLTGESSEQLIVDEYLETNKEVTRIYGTIYRRTLDKGSVYLKESYLKIHSELIFLDRIKVYMEEEQNLPIGAGVIAVGKLKKIEPPGNPGQFNSQQYYATQHIAYTMVKTTVELEKLPVYSYRNTLASIRDFIAESLEKTTGEYAPIFHGMLLGDKSQLEDEIRDRYQMAGIMHILAISGLHLSLLGMGCYNLLMKIGAGIPLSGSLTIILLFSYGMLTGEGVATMRALIMFVISMGAKIMGRTYDLLSALALSGLLILVESPSYLLYSGFLLSFGAVCGIAFVLPFLTDLFHKEEKIRIFTFLREGFLASGSIQIATLPLTLYFFYEFPLYGIFVNLMVIPTLALVVATGLLAGTIGLVWPGGGGILAAPGCVLLTIYDRLAEVVQNLPGASWVAGQPHIWQILMYYFILAGVLYTNFRKKKQGKKVRWCGKGAMVTAVFGAVLVLAIRVQSEFTLTCLDVGQGDCGIIRTPSGRTHLLDGGSSNVQNVGRYRILPYLKSQGIHSVDFAWISHTDGDHISGIQEILKLQSTNSISVEIKTIILPRWKVTTEAYSELEETAKSAGAEVIYVSAGDILTDGEMTMEVLAPDVGAGEDPNESSTVVEITYGEFQGIFTGDIGFETEEILKERLGDCDFLKVAHHGSRYSTSDEFLEITTPEIGVISCSSTNTYGHPHEDTLSRLENINCNVWCTKDVGAVTVSTDGQEVWVEGYLEK